MGSHRHKERQIAEWSQRGMVAHMVESTIWQERGVVARIVKSTQLNIETRD